jgi:hypothetical protein
MYHYECTITLLHIYILLIFNMGALGFICNSAVSVSLRAQKYVILIQIIISKLIYQVTRLNVNLP